ncbi:PKD domain-containing protein, partial [Treponema primitia]|uniref:PKD domain-containing protein n=1 Tax=Treponema primitia TaxID=88058 RepID=UPI0002555088
ALTALTGMTASVTYTGASISPDPTTARSYVSPVPFTVTAADGSTQDYTVTVTIAAASTAKEITAFTITSPVSASGTVNETE